MVHRRGVLAMGAGLTVTAIASRARAEATELRMSHGFSVLYLPQMVMARHGLVEKHARALGLGDVKASWRLVDGGNSINDALLAGTIDVAALGTPGFLTLWSKTQRIPASAVLGLSGLSTAPMLLSTTNPNVRTLADFGPGDHIAVAGIKTSLPAGILQMMVAHAFGPEHYDRLDRYTVGVPYPDATAAMLSGKSEINAHVASPPFSFMEADSPKIHVVANSADILGNVSLLVTVAQRRFHDANPGLCRAYVAALDEANAAISADPNDAAATYNHVSDTKLPVELMLRILADKDVRFSTTPNGIVQWAQFNKRTGIISQDVTDWRTLFFPEAHGLAGS